MGYPFDGAPRPANILSFASDMRHIIDAERRAAIARRIADEVKHAENWRGMDTRGETVVVLHVANDDDASEQGRVWTEHGG